MTRYVPPEPVVLAGLGLLLAGVGMLGAIARQAIASGVQGRRKDIQPGTRSLADIMRDRPRPRRKPPEAGLPVFAVPPGGPSPMIGGAAAPLDFES